MRTAFALVLLLTLAVSVCGSQNENNTNTTGLTSVVSQRDGNVFTWTVINNTGAGDGQPGWDVLIWEVIPDELPHPITVGTPAGWEWVDKGNKGQFQVEPSEKYHATPIAPGQSAVFTYTVDPALQNVENPTFTTHVGAVLPEPVVVDGVTTWTPTSVNGRGSWFDQPAARQTSSNPEPRGLLAGLVWCGGLIAFAKRARPRRET